MPGARGIVAQRVYCPEKWAEGNESRVQGAFMYNAKYRGVRWLGEISLEFNEDRAGFFVIMYSVRIRQVVCVKFLERLRMIEFILFVHVILLHSN